MALELKRIIEFNFCVKCDITRKLIAYGDFYYEDDEDGFVVCADYYHKQKQAAKMEEALLNPEISFAMDPISHQTRMRAAERQYLNGNLLDRPVIGKGYIKGGNPNA